MKPIKVFFDRTGNTLNVWFDDPQKEHVSEETSEEVVLVKDKFEDRGLILEALQRGIDEAMIQHKRAGLPVVIERNGKIEWVMPEDLGY